MDWLKKLRGELIDIIEWPDDNPSVLVWKFQRHNNEIKNGAQLTVRPGQVAVFVDEGRIADVFQPGRHKLDTANLPILSTIRGWKYGFVSPFKVDVYFVATRQFTDLKWGTMNPVMLRDPEFGPVRLRAYGTYAIKASNAATLINAVAGAGSSFTIDGITEQLRNVIVSRFTDVLGESGIPILDLAANYDELSDFLRQRIATKINEYGLDLTTLLVENISLPPNVEEALDKRSSMGIIGDLSKYTQYQTAEAIGDAAKNPGGGMGDAMGLGAGFAMAQQMASTLNNPNANNPNARAASPPPPPGAPHQPAFHLYANSQQTGPFAHDQLRHLAATGALTPDTLVWSPGMSNWTRAAEVPALAPILSPPPPPPPHAGANPPPPPPPPTSPGH
ncbi:MAG: SPFH domain-containing protein [Phycisphaerales bacterium]